MIGLVEGQWHARSAGGPVALDAIVLIAHAAGQRPLRRKAPGHLREHAQTVLLVVEGRRASQIQQVIGIHVVVVDARHATEAVVGRLEAGTQLLREITRIHMGTTVAHRHGYPFGVAAAVLQLVVQSNPAAQVIGQIMHPCPPMGVESGHGQRGIVQPVMGSIGRLGRGQVAAQVGKRQLRFQARHRTGRPQQLDAAVDVLGVGIGIPLGIGGIDVIDVGVAAAVVQRNACSQFLVHQRPRQHHRGTPRLATAQLQLRRTFRLEGGILGVDNDRTGNAVGPQRRRLRTAIDLDGIHVPDGRGAKGGFPEVQVVAVDIDTGPWHRTSIEGACAGTGPLAIDAPDDGRTARPGIQHVGDVARHIPHCSRLGLLLQVTVADDGHRTGGFLHRAAHLLASDDHAAQGGDFAGIGPQALGLCKRSRGGKNGRKGQSGGSQSARSPPPA